MRLKPSESASEGSAGWQEDRDSRDEKASGSATVFSSLLSLVSLSSAFCRASPYGFVISIKSRSNTSIPSGLPGTPR
jgi:hypothetical protein